MPTRAPQRCTLCPRLATHQGRCDKHQRKPWENPSANTRHLTSADRARFRRAVLQAYDHRCAICGNPATEADHVIEVADLVAQGGDPTDPTNGQALCTPHHRLKTLAARKARAARRKRG